MTVRFEYELTGTGWARSELTIGRLNFVATASYLSDALQSLLEAVVRILEGESEATASFAEEPGEFRWKFYQTADTGHVLVRVFWFDDELTNSPDDEGKEVFAATCCLRALAEAVYVGCFELLESLGVDGYHDRWVANEFPLTEFEAIRYLLDIKPNEEQRA